MFCISMYSEVSMPKNTCTIRPTVHVGIDHFIYHGYIYWICVSFVFPCTVKVSIRTHTCTIRPTVHHEIEYFLSWLYIQDFCMFCISKYPKGINTKLHLHYKTKCTS